MICHFLLDKGTVDHRKPIENPTKTSLQPTPCLILWWPWTWVSWILFNSNSWCNRLECQDLVNSSNYTSNSKGYRIFHQNHNHHLLATYATSVDKQVKRHLLVRSAEQWVVWIGKSTHRGWHVYSLFSLGHWIYYCPNVPKGQYVPRHTK